jgi:hypothetical protein
MRLASMRRFVPVAIVGILLAGILSDPYTYSRDGSDAIRSAPIWQLGFAILDVGALLAIVALSIRGKSRGALFLVVLETLYYFGGNTILYLRDGPSRFVHGLGAESNLGEHVIVVVLRLCLILFMVRMPVPTDRLSGRV